MSASSRARAFHALHQEGLLILPNAWDAGSARLIAHAGAPAIATSSAALAWMHGYPDGQALPLATMLASVREIVEAVDIPVSADIEAGFAPDAAAAGEAAARLLDTGAVGINIEDGLGAADLLAAKVERIRAVAVKAGIDLWINARSDVYLRRLAEGEAAYAETIARARQYREAGADSIFVPAAAGEDLLSRLVKDVVLPLNILAWPGVPPAERLRRIGVRRLSAGAGLARVAMNQVYAMAKAFLQDGESEPFQTGELKTPDINRLMTR